MHCCLWNMIIYPCPNFNGGLSKPPLKLGNGCVITSYDFIWMCQRIHTRNSMLAKLTSSGKGVPAQECLTGIVLMSLMFRRHVWVLPVLQASMLLIYFILDEGCYWNSKNDPNLFLFYRRPYISIYSQMRDTWNIPIYVIPGIFPYTWYLIYSHIPDIPMTKCVSENCILNPIIIIVYRFLWNLFMELVLNTQLRQWWP